ncbi:MAG: hypothetical protein KGV51_04795 [Moraxellaceae bacterium]|nr:hypothetical protein [Moraxellaceae bacterium]
MNKQTEDKPKTQKQIVLKWLLEGKYVSSDDMQNIDGEVKAKSQRDVIYHLNRDFKKLGIDTISYIWLVSSKGKRYKNWFMTAEHRKAYYQAREQTSHATSI